MLNADMHKSIDVKQQMKTIVALSIVAVIALPLGASAHAGHDHEPATPVVSNTQEKAAELRQKVEDQKQSRQERSQEAKTRVNEQLSENQRKLCSNNQTRANTMMKNMDDRRQRAYDHVTRVYESVKKFSATKQLEFDGYTSLIATIDDAQSAALTAMQAQHKTPELDCSHEKPRAAIADFKLKRTESIDAMQTYRQAVKQLIHSVKTAAKEGSA